MQDEKNLAYGKDISFRAIVSTRAFGGPHFRCHIWRCAACGFQGIEVFITIEDLLAAEVADLELDVTIEENVLQL